MLFRSRIPERYFRRFGARRGCCLIVYVESNFILEVALSQEEASAAKSILDLARLGTLELRVPSFALCEPFSTISHRGREGRKLVGTLGETMRQLLRSESYRKQLQEFESVPEALARIYGQEIDLLESTIRELLVTAQVLQLTRDVFEQALEVQRTLGLSPQDAIIYASVLQDLRTNPVAEALFVSRNYKDFSDPEILVELGALNCEYKDSYADAIALIERH